MGRRPRPAGGAEGSADSGARAGRSTSSSRRPTRPGAAIHAKRIHDPAARSDGTRILVMRLWPRGVRRERVDLWLKELGPVVSLLRAYRAGAIGWPEYCQAYVGGLERPEARAALEQVRLLAREGPVTLLCGCPDEARCHRSLLREHLAKGSGRG